MLPCWKKSITGIHSYWCCYHSNPMQIRWRQIHSSRFQITEQTVGFKNPVRETNKILNKAFKQDSYLSLRRDGSSLGWLTAVGAGAWLTERARRAGLTVYFTDSKWRAARFGSNQSQRQHRLPLWRALCVGPSAGVPAEVADRVKHEPSWCQDEFA